MRQKSPESDIPKGSFYKDIPRFNVYVKKKDPKDGLLKDVMIYDYSEGLNNARVIVANSRRLKTSADKLFLVLSLSNGEFLENVGKSRANMMQARTAVPYRRESFSSRNTLTEFDASFNRTDESFMQNQCIEKNLKDLQTSIDSMGVRLDNIKDVNAKSIYDASYIKALKSLRAKKESEAEGQLGERQEKLPVVTPIIQLDFDGFHLAQATSNQVALLDRAKPSIENIKTDYYSRTAMVGNEAYKIRRHLTEWHKKSTIPFACIMFFFIGALLGAVTRKGGLDVPVIISVILSIFYYIIDNMSFKMTRDGVWDAREGMWPSSAILAPMGIFLTYKAVKDSVILNADTYVNALKNLVGKCEGRKVERKEAAIYIPGYEAILPQLEKSVEEGTTYLTNHKRWINYLAPWKQGEKDNTAELLVRDTENIVEELSNSDQNLLLNKLMDYPVIGGYNNKLSKHINGKLALAIGILFPPGLSICLLATYQRKLLRHDIVMVRETSKEPINVIYSLHLLKK